MVELLGRRVLLLLGFSVCFTACCVLTAALALQVRKGGLCSVHPGALAGITSKITSKKTRMIF